MWLKRISILNYKNLEQVELGFSRKLNCIIGKNGMGKTNLMDAVYYLSFCKSATNPIDSQNIFHDRDFFVIQGFYENGLGEPEEVYCGLKQEGIFPPVGPYRVDSSGYGVACRFVVDSRRERGKAPVYGCGYFAVRP